MKVNPLLGNESDRMRIQVETAINDALAWLESNQLAEKEEFEHKQKEVEGICTPIMQSLYSQGGGGGMGGMPGGMVSTAAALPSLPVPLAVSACARALPRRVR